jgi:hypothetical protein
MKKILLIIVFSLLGIIFIASGVVYSIASVGPNVISSSITEDISIILPKSEVFKVTSTAKGDNQSKVARLNDDVFTFYLDNTGCTDASARGNDKTMQLIHIKADGTYLIFDSIPVWMHGNVLTDLERQLIYYTTYEEELIEGIYYNKVKIYTYQLLGGILTRIDEQTIADDLVVSDEANPRIGAYIDNDGNIAIAFGNYRGTMFVHVYDAINDTWIKHAVHHYLDTYEWDSNMYPYVRIDGIDHIRIVASRDAGSDEFGHQYPNPARDYTRYFQYDGDGWTHFILSDLRDRATPDGKLLNAVPVDLMMDEDLTSHIIIEEDNSFHYYLVSLDGTVTETDILKVTPEIAVTFIRFTIVNNHRYYVVSGDGIKGFSKTGFIEIYDYDTHKLLYRNNSICNAPYLYIAKQTDNDYLDFVIISRDKNYQENSDTHYLRLKFI